MEYHDQFVIDFAKRTRANLEWVESNAKGREGELFEVTQLCNSLLGLIVFPKERWAEIWTSRKKQKWALSRLGMPTFVNIDGRLKHENVAGLVEYVRHGIAHGNVEFVPGEDRKLAKLRITNRDPSGYPPWTGEFQIQDLRTFVLALCDLIGENRE